MMALDLQVRHETAQKPLHSEACAGEHKAGDCHCRYTRLAAHCKPLVVQPYTDP